MFSEQQIYIPKITCEIFMQKWILCFLFVFSSQLPCVFAADSKYILPEDHFLQKPLATIFQDPEILASRQSLEQAGFQLFSHHHRGMAVGRHPLLKGHLIKVFFNDVPHALQVQNYISRIEGARHLQEYIDKHALQHIVTPKKWLYPIKENAFGITCVLVVEEIDIVSSSETRELYANIDPDVLEELCMVLKRFRGLDSVTKNMPFTRDGKIAFVDTEKWRSMRSEFLEHVVRHLDSERLEIIRPYAAQDSIDEWLLPKKHPLHKRLNKLFSDSRIFDSPLSLQEIGCDVNKRVHKKLMVFTHPDVPEYIFKKFQNSVLRSEQLEKYIIRLKGAKAVRDAIKQHRLSNIVVPNKWLYRLPNCRKSYLVIAERFDICAGDDKPDGENVQRYRTMSYKTLHELCTIMKALGGCDAWPRNQPFTKQGKIAFIDTEHVGHKEAHFAKHILPLLDAQMQEYAQKVLAAA